MLTDDQIEEIRRSCYDVMYKVGFKVLHARARKMLKQAGCQVRGESAFSILAQGLGSLNLIHDVGYMDDGTVCSAAQLVLGNENIGMTKRFARGITVNHETLAKIKKKGEKLLT